MNSSSSAIFGGTGTAPTKVTDFDIVEEALATANSVASRIEHLADALLGVAPQPPSPGGVGCEVPGGVLPRMAGKATYARGRLGDAMVALDRIERSLPA